MEGGPPGFRQGSSCPALLRYRTRESRPFRIRGCHALRQAFPDLSPTDRFSQNSPGCPRAALQPRLTRFRLLRFRSPLLPESLLISFPRLLRWFTSPGMAPPAYFIQPSGAYLPVRGLPHSAIRGSRDMCSSPRLFAAYHGLHRPAAPRHPP